MLVRERRINRPQHVRVLMQEQINILRQDETLDPIERARAIAYLSNTALSAYKDGEAMEKLESIQKQLDELKKRGS